MRTVGILIFDDVEVLDFAGPFEVFAVASQVHNFELFDVFTIGKTSSITAVNGLSVNPKFSLENAPSTDILVIPGGVGSRKLIEDDEILNWVRDRHEKSELTLTVCTGSRVLAKLGLLAGVPYCTHQSAYSSLAEMAMSGIPRHDLRFVQAGRIWTSGGISAGIDLSLHIVGLLHGNESAERTSDYMEYRRLGAS